MENEKQYKGKGKEELIDKINELMKKDSCNCSKLGLVYELLIRL